MNIEMEYADPSGGCDVCCDIAPFPDGPPEHGDRYECPQCHTVWTARDVTPCSLCRGEGVIERQATPEEVDNGCELGIAVDPCPQCSVPHD